MKIGVLITARLKSTRLPLKLLLHIGRKPVIDHVIERAKMVSRVDQIVLCTSTNLQDAPLVEAAHAQRVHYFMGHPDDVLLRLYEAATFYRLDYVLSITADNPFFSVEYANLLTNEALLRKPDFMYVEGLPLGASIYGIRYEALKTVVTFKENMDSDTEIWGYWLNQPHIFDVHVIQARKEEFRDVRLTLDTYEDLHYLQQLGEMLGERHSLGSILSAIDRLPYASLFNREVVQKQLASDKKAEIERLYQDQMERLLLLKEQIYKS
ncbi:cytidylyltransferase domain-containing protein [Paenibacillus sp. Soil522]|uniref:cytidylyltransferase domain-containing protein n=1 Tax=Paenibacillus sp. Soil522 TaxID=1736388 RepID=UPI0006F28B50|nr:hypothetical protein [Paenibacillus sp. Soil522]KRE46305.1 hypothetical protein ASG81_11915 [Paenibacillus sp. Soil522]